MKRTAWITGAAIAVVLVAFGVIAWHRRWLADDGLIFLRTVREILAGNGPVFNHFERAESNTSTLWPWLLAGVAFVSRANLNHLAVVLGWLCTVGGLALAADATRRLQRAMGATGVLVPAGLFVVIGAPPFADYATSGLENGLCTLWLGIAWWILVSLRADASRRRVIVAAVVLGLGPLARPDLALVSASFLVAGWLIVRPSWRATLGLIAAAGALPVAYEIFRAGYYGTLVPLPALAKSASSSAWRRGYHYMLDFSRAYVVWVAVLAILALAVMQLKKAARRERIVTAAPVVASALMTLYVLRVGGDFMHARMLLAPTLLVSLPVAVVAIDRRVAAAVVVLAVWSVIGAQMDRMQHWHAKNVEDERAGYVYFTGVAHPIDDAAFDPVIPGAAVARAALREHRQALVFESGFQTAANPAHAVPLEFLAGRLGCGGMATPLDGIVIDTLGLSNPLGARITATLPGATGHEKLLPMAWVVADFVDPAIDPGTLGVPRIDVRAARHAMQCGELAELLHSVRDPLTASRFWANLTGAVRRTRLVIPADPIEAERKFCGAASRTRFAKASSAYEQAGWAVDNAVDDDIHTTPASRGFSSGLGNHTDHVEWLEVTLPTTRPLSCVVLHPRDDGPPGVGFPTAFAIQTWNGGAWVDRVVRSDEPTPAGPLRLCWEHSEPTDRVRLYATHLREVASDGYVLQLAELETP